MKKKHQLNKIERDRIIQRITTHLLENEQDIAAVYVFGSFLDYESFADIDIGIFSGRVIPSPLEYELRLESALEKIAKLPVDIRILNKAPLAFVQNVIRNGKLIVDLHPNRRADFESRILKEYFDFSPFQRQYLREVENAPI